MTRHRVPLLLGAAALTVIVSSCASSPGVGTTYLTGAPMRGSGAPELRVVDNAGYVYPGGQTAEVGQGVGPGVVGHGSYMTRPPMKEEARSRSASTGPSSREAGTAGSAPRQPSGADRQQTLGRVASALCDLEASCARVGRRGVFESMDACANEQRARLADRFAPDCEVRGEMLAECLRAIRTAECSASSASSSTLPPACGQALPTCG